MAALSSVMAPDSAARYPSSSQNLLNMAITLLAASIIIDYPLHEILVRGVVRSDGSPESALSACAEPSSDVGARTLAELVSPEGLAKILFPPHKHFDGCDEIRLIISWGLGCHFFAILSRFRLNSFLNWVAARRWARAITMVDVAMVCTDGPVSARTGNRAAPLR